MDNVIKIKEYGGYAAVNNYTKGVKDRNRSVGAHMLIPISVVRIINLKEVEILITEGKIILRACNIDTRIRRKIHTSISLPSKFMEYLGEYTLEQNPDNTDEFELIPV